MLVETMGVLVNDSALALELKRIGDEVVIGISGFDGPSKDPPLGGVRELDVGLIPECVGRVWTVALVAEPLAAFGLVTAIPVGVGGESARPSVWSRVTGREAEPTLVLGADAVVLIATEVFSVALCPWGVVSAKGLPVAAVEAGPKEEESFWAAEMLTSVSFRVSVPSSVWLPAVTVTGGTAGINSPVFRMVL